MKTKFVYQLKKIFQWHWHVFPIPKDYLILSVYEFVVYLLLFALILFLYASIQIVPVKNDTIEFKNIHFVSPGMDTKYGLKVHYHKPMTFAYGEDEKNKGICDLRIYGVKDSVYYIDDRPIDSLFQIYKSFGEVYNDTLSVYYIKFIQHDNTIEQARSFSEYPWKKVGDEGLYSIKRMHKEEEGLILECVLPTGVVTTKDISDGPLSRPSWYSLFDISQTYFELKIKYDSNAVKGEIVIDFVGATEFSRMKPEPDEITYSSVIFRDWDKIKEIANSGLKFHAKFVELENFQNARIFILGAILSALFAILLTFAVLAIYKVTRKFRKVKSDLNDSTLINHNKIWTRPQHAEN